MRLRYLYLLGLALILGWLSHVAYQAENHWLESFTSNLAAGFLGAFLTVLLIDRAITRERETQRAQIRKTALSQLRPAMLTHLSLLSDWYKAASLTKPQEVPTFRALFNDDFFEQIRFLDFSKNAAAHRDWFLLSAEICRNLQDSLLRILDRYAIFF